MGLRRLGVLTGGGDCPGLNAVLRTVTRKAIRDYRAKVFGIADGFGGLMHRKVRPLGIDDVSGILPRGGTILGTTNRSNPFDEDGKDVSDSVVRYVRKLRLDGLICVGGDGTMTIAAGLARKGVPVVGVPKTIDNDVVGTDVTFGFDTAVSVATRAIDDLHTTADAHGRVLVVEVMGRHAGWIALTSGLAGGADVILVPELPFRYPAVARYIRERHKSRRFTIICIAEGAHPKGGRTVEKRRGVLGGVAMQVALKVEKLSGFETRAVVLGHLQRSGAPSAADRILASRYAAAAVDFAAEGVYGHMAAIRNGALIPVPIEEAAGRTRTIPRNHELMALARSLGTCFG